MTANVIVLTFYPLSVNCCMFSEAVVVQMNELKSHIYQELKNQSSILRFKSMREDRPMYKRRLPLTREIL